MVKIEFKVPDLSFKNIPALYQDRFTDLICLVVSVNEEENTAKGVVLQKSTTFPEYKVGDYIDINLIIHEWERLPSGTTVVFSEPVYSDTLPSLCIDYYGRIMLVNEINTENNTISGLILLEGEDDHYQKATYSTFDGIGCMKKLPSYYPWPITLVQP